MAAFSYFDKDGSGCITMEELRQACIDHKMGDAKISDIIKEIDQNNVCLCMCFLLKKLCKQCEGDVKVLLAEKQNMQKQQGDVHMCNNHVILATINFL